MTKKELVAALREIMKQHSVEAVYITGTDPHGSDGVATHWRVMQWFSGFSGTAGSLGFVGFSGTAGPLGFTAFSSLYANAYVEK